ncbi:uncharacterized protein C8Q71DRAFT_723162 [Rhodofomes roseus]|uniref:F-box domain-containing protein n=1 Tax=Rhodofomes roseus TaxID=34475 RepID=A0ABQ8KIX1_9APHY|nr:uncharacterized protein C8Q71DRAFT_723162 [Rhodofomes roseus]KAH9837903.1 hypothetical protein C8Q71DRAFT_723162 [Rhodofomes roseus]
MLPPDPSLPSIPLDVVDEILQHLYPSGVFHSDSYADFLAGKEALARCACVCRAFQTPAVKVLWREQTLTNACGAVLREFTFACVKGPLDADDEDGDEGDDDDNEDWPVGIDPDDHLYTYNYLPGPISPEEWSRFKYYAQFIRVLRYTLDEKVDSSVLFYLHQHTHGEPLFPNLRKLEWCQAVPDLVSVISPTIQVLCLREESGEEENYCQPHELAYRTRRHALKTLLPGILGRMPDLQELEIRPLHHEGFWLQLASLPGRRFATQSIRVLHISESLDVLLSGALPAISTSQNLHELRIDVLTYEDDAYPPATRREWSKASIRTFVELRRLRIEGSVSETATLVDVIIAPELEDIELHRMAHSDSESSGIPALLRASLHTLGTRNAGSLRRVKLVTYGSASDMAFSELIRPLLPLRHLDELDIDDPAARVIDSSAPTMLAAWQMLEKLSLAVMVLSPERLQGIVRNCPRLKRLKVLRLSKDFPLIPPVTSNVSDAPDSRGIEHGLEELCVVSPFKVTEPAGITAIARFLNKLFPRLRPERCVDTTHTTDGDGDWDRVLQEMANLRLSG